VEPPETEVFPVIGAPKVATFSFPCVEVPLSDSLIDSMSSLRFALAAPLGGGPAGGPGTDGMLGLVTKIGAIDVPR
jgi:hypothetical protein